MMSMSLFFFASSRRHTRSKRDWSSDGALPIFGAEGHAQEALHAGCRRNEERVEHRVLEGAAHAATRHVASPACPRDDEPDPTDEEHDEQQGDEHCAPSPQTYTGQGAAVIWHSPSRRLDSNVSSCLPSSSTPSPTRVSRTVTRLVPPPRRECRSTTAVRPG